MAKLKPYEVRIEHPETGRQMTVHRGVIEKLGRYSDWHILDAGELVEDTDPVDEGDADTEADPLADEAEEDN